MGRTVLRLAVGMTIAVLINGGLAIGMAMWADLGSPPRRAKPTRKPAEIPFVKTRPPKNRLDP